jgi:hypothetical protein
MRRRRCTATPSSVRSLAHAARRRALPRAGDRRLVPPERLLDLLLPVAALRSSLAAVARRFRFGFCHETARHALRANLPDGDRRTAGPVDALHAFADPAWRQRRWDAAVDRHYCPFYGDRRARGVVGGPHQQGTTSCYAYATAVRLHQRRRYTVGLLPVGGSQRPDALLAALPAPLDARGLRPRGVALDSGFASGAAVRLLKRRGRSYVAPLRRKGRGSNARNDWFARPAGQVFTAAWRTDRSRRRVRTAAVRGRRPRDGKVLVYAFGGWGAGAARSAAERARRGRLARRKYRARYGIETSYRRLNEGKGRTTAKGGRYRLLLLGLGLLLRQAWVWLTGQVARRAGRGPAGWVGELPLARRLGGPADAMRGSTTSGRRSSRASRSPPPKG